MRLNKYLALAGFGSRRGVEDLILAGKVKINGKQVKDLAIQVSSQDKVFVEGKQARSSSYVSFIVNKPKGYLCSNERTDPRENLVIDLFHKCPERLFTVGRLDKESEGLLLVTNDGDFAQKVIHPSSNIDKEYVADCKQSVSDGMLNALRKGGFIDGVKVVPKRVHRLSTRRFKITVKEGRNREVRRLAARVGLQITSLRRIRIGGLFLSKLEKGEWRELSERQKESLFAD